MPSAVAVVAPAAANCAHGPLIAQLLAGSFGQF
jgi:hypothetical protein